jgi:hypothetical protein
MNAGDIVFSRRKSKQYDVSGYLGRVSSRAVLDKLDDLSHTILC